MKNIKSGEYTQIISGAKNVSGKGKEYLVRFYNGMIDEYMYVTDGTKIYWLEPGDYIGDKDKKMFATITSNNSEKYFVKNKLFRSTSPQGNGSIDHFVELENGKILATTIEGDLGYIEVSKKEYEEEEWIDRF